MSRNTLTLTGTHGRLTCLECAAACGAGPYDPFERHHLCACGAPLLARYDLAALTTRWNRHALNARPATLWRYREVLPVSDDQVPVSLAEGFTPLVHARRLGRSLRMDGLYVKDESTNPTASFKARGLSVAVTRARSLGAPSSLGTICRIRGQRACRVCGTRRTLRVRLHATGRQAPVYSRVRALRCHGHLGRWPHHRCGPRCSRAR